MNSRMYIENKIARYMEAKLWECLRTYNIELPGGLERFKECLIKEIERL